MSTELPTKPGPYYWREKDGGQWVIRIVDADDDGELHVLLDDVDIWLPIPIKPTEQWLPIPPAEELVELQSAKKMVDEKHDGWAIFQRGEFCLSVPTQDYVTRLIEKITGYPWVTLSSEANYTCEPVKIIRNQDQK